MRTSTESAFRSSVLLSLAVALPLGLSGCSLFNRMGSGANRGCGDSITITPVSAKQTVDTIREATTARAARNPKRTVQANLIADYGRGPTGRRTRSDVSILAQVDGSFARLKVTAEASVPMADVLLTEKSFSVVNYPERRILQGDQLARGSDRAPFVPLARAMVQVLDPESALAARFRRQPKPGFEEKAGEYILTFGRPDGRQEVWYLRQRDLMPTKLQLREGLAVTSEIVVTGYKEASDGSGPVPTCANLLVDPGVEISIRTGVVRRSVTIPAASRQQERPGDFKVLNI